MDIIPLGIVPVKVDISGWRLIAAPVSVRVPPIIPIGAGIIMTIKYFTRARLLQETTIVVGHRDWAMLRWPMAMSQVAPRADFGTPVRVIVSYVTIFGCRFFNIA